MLKFSSTRKDEIRSEVTFRGTLLRNGIMSLSDELKYASDYDNILNDATDSLFDNISNNATRAESNSLSDNLEEKVINKEELQEIQKNILSADITHNNATCDYDFVNNTCQCFSLCFCSSCCGRRLRCSLQPVTIIESPSAISRQRRLSTLPKHLHVALLAQRFAARVRFWFQCIVASC